MSARLLGQEEYEVSLGGEEYTVRAKYSPSMRGSFEKGGLQITPDDPAEVEIDSVQKDGEDITADCSEEFLDQLAETILEQIQDEGY